MGSTFVLAIVIVAALAFDFTNGFHDTANARATSIATGALKPMVAVVISAVLNFVGAFISISVATTIAKGIVPSSATAGIDGLAVVEAALIGAMVWNLIAWYFTIPSSSSHALIGGLIGASIASVGSSGVSVHGIIQKVVAPGVLAIFVCGAVAFLATSAAYLLIRRLGKRNERSRADLAASITASGIFLSRMALIGDILRTGLRKGGEHGDRAWQAVTEMPDYPQNAALGSVVDDLEEGGFALFRIGGDEPG